MNKLNPSLEPGNEIVLVDMDDPWPNVTPGTKGIVKQKSNVMGTIQYQVDWENGSKLDLIDGVDSWILSDDVKRLKEQSQDVQDMEFFLRNVDKFKNYDIKFLREYLNVLRESSITNMFGAARFLYMGKDRIEHEFMYDEITEDNEAYEKLLELADKAQSIMVTGVIKTLEQNKKELDVAVINRELSRASIEICKIFYRLF